MADTADEKPVPIECFVEESEEADMAPAKETCTGRLQFRYKNMSKRVQMELENMSKWQAIGLASFIFLFQLTMTTLLTFNLITLIWKGASDEGTQGFIVALLGMMTLIPCCMGCCKRSFFSGAYGGHRKWRALFVGSPCAGWLGFLIFILALFYSDFPPVLIPEYDVNEPVVIVGTGPSGIAAAWTLAKSGRRVLMLEATDEIGGHSKSVKDENGMDIDIGFIFNNHNYMEYMLVANHTGYPLVDTALNTSGAWQGEYWDNTRDDHDSEEEIAKDLERWMELAEEEPDMLRLLTPLGAFLWWNGFSEKFYRLAIESTMTVLFVTKMGALRQSAAAVLSYYQASSGGFIHVRPDGIKRVQYNPGGSQNMWYDMIADMNSTGLVEIRLNSKVTGKKWEDDAWTLEIAGGKSVAGYKHVVMACPAYASQQIIGNQWHKFILSQVQYEESYLTLHKDPEATVAKDIFSQADDNVLYFVEPEEGVMTGKIGKIFGNETSDLLLTVHFEKKDIDESKVIKQYVWYHHMFHIWELGVARKMVPVYYPSDGIYLAGDWLFGVGHNDAIKSGVAAACAVGIPETLDDPAAAHLYDNLVRRVCVDHMAFA